ALVRTRTAGVSHLSAGVTLGKSPSQVRPPRIAGDRDGNSGNGRTGNTTGRAAQLPVPDRGDRTRARGRDRRRLRFPRLDVPARHRRPAGMTLPPTSGSSPPAELAPEIHIAGVLVHCRPAALARVERSVAALERAEPFQSSDDGKLVVVVESASSA